MNGFDRDFVIFRTLFFIIFFLVLGVIIVAAARSILMWHKNNNSPRLSVDAVIVTKRMNVSNHRHSNEGDITGEHGYFTSSSTFYYVTFQVESGDRMELSVSGQEYGLLAEGDQGRLTFQGTRFLCFERSI